MKNLIWKLSIIAILLNCFVPLLAQELPKLVPFQGRLTDANGNSVTAGSKVVQFKIYNAPVGGQAVWNGEVQKLTVNGGLVSTTLGTKASLAGVDFNRNLYLELTIDANDDGQISAADPPLLPRQSIMPAVFAVESGDSRKLAGNDWSSILVSGNDPANGFIRGDKLNTNSVTAAQIAGKTITANQIADASITALQIAANTITSNQIADGTIISSKLSPDFGLSAASLTSGTLSDARLSANVALRIGANTFVGNQVVTSGNVGIGINPSARLHVMGLSAFDQMLLHLTGFHAQGAWLNLQSTATGGNQWNIISTANGNSEGSGKLIFRNANQVTIPLTLTADGSVGIGNRFPTNLLMVGNARCNGTSWINASDRNLKENFVTVDARDMLERVASLPIRRWNYKSAPGTQHIGPVAQDFKASFGVGVDDVSIATIDADGVALAAVQGLNQKLEEQAAQLRDKDAELQSLKKRLTELEKTVLALIPRPSP